MTNVSVYSFLPPSLPISQFVEGRNNLTAITVSAMELTLTEWRRPEPGQVCPVSRAPTEAGTDGRTDGRGGIDGCRGGITGRSAPILFCFCFGNWDGNFVCFIYLNGKTILWLWNRLGNWSRIFFIFLMDSMDIGLGFDQIAIGSKVGQNSAKTSSKFNQN